MTVFRQDLENAAALIEAAVHTIKSAIPVIDRFLAEQPSLQVSGKRAAGSVVVPIFRAAAELVRVHEGQIAAARAALDKVTAK